MIAPQDWTERGRVLGATLNAHYAIVVAGTDAVATAEVALGIARFQARFRRVAVGDLLGDAPPLQALVEGVDPHGLVDSFLFGVSLNRIAHAVAGAGELFVMPSGTAPLEYEELLPHPRWRKLASGFREVGALLLLVAPVGAERLRDLVDVTDGVVIVGDEAPTDIPVAQALAWLRPKRSTVAPLAMVESARARPRRDQERVVAGAAAGVVLAISLAAAAFWFARRPFASEAKARRSMPVASPEARAVTAGSLASDSAAQALADSIRRDSITKSLGATPAVDSFPLLVPTNARDSAAASAWAVRLEQTNTKSGAILDLRGRFETVPAGTYGFDLRTRFFLLVAGAYPSRAGAESLLVQLRAHKILAPGIGSVTSLPFAFLVQADVPATDVAARLARFAARGQPVYALRQTSGAANLYFGAYETPQQAALAVPTVRESGLTPTLVYRIGRVF